VREAKTRLPATDGGEVEGDVISIDCGAIVGGWHGDAAITVPIGEVAPEVTELMRVTTQNSAEAGKGGRRG
jgi:methionyl aminopeptidase